MFFWREITIVSANPSLKICCIIPILFSFRPLHIAARNGLVPIVQELLLKGSSVMALDENGKLTFFFFTFFYLYLYINLFVYNYCLTTNVIFLHKYSIISFMVSIVGIYLLQPVFSHWHLFFSSCYKDKMFRMYMVLFNIPCTDIKG